MKKERLTTSDEQRERTLIAEQIERAAAEAGPSNSAPPEAVAEGLKREEGAEKVVFSLSTKPAASSSAVPSTSATPIGLKMNPLKPANPLKASNPLKRPNVFKSAGATPSSSSSTSTAEKRSHATMSAAERLIIEDQERKRRKMERDGTA
jgi:DNA/RNA-binding protein KIN17